MELISREKVLKILKTAHFKDVDNDNCKCQKIIGDITLSLSNLPTIESRSKGKWIDSEGKEVKSRYCAHCSICGGWSEYLTDFCGNCGADMRKE